MEKGILIIPDVHGRDFWKKAVDSKRYDRIIFLGDYADPYDFEGIFSLPQAESTRPVNTDACRIFKKIGNSYRLIWAANLIDYINS